MVKHQAAIGLTCPRIVEVPWLANNWNLPIKLVSKCVSLFTVSTIVSHCFFTQDASEEWRFKNDRNVTIQTETLESILSSEFSSTTYPNTKQVPIFAHYTRCRQHPKKHKRTHWTGNFKKRKKTPHLRHQANFTPTLEKNTSTWRLRKSGPSSVATCFVKQATGESPDARTTPMSPAALAANEGCAARAPRWSVGLHRASYCWKKSGEKTTWDL